MSNPIVILYGRLEQITPVKTYIKLQFSTSVPFKLQYETFNIWDKSLKRTSRQLLDQDVSITLPNFQFNEFCFFSYLVLNSLVLLNYLFLLFIMCICLLNFIFFQVELSYRLNAAGYKTVTKIRPATLDCCSRCSTTREVTNAQTVCEPCLSLEDTDIPERVVSQLVKIKDVSRKKLKYSKAISFEFIFTNNTRTIHSETIFERSPLFETAMLLERGLSTIVSGWLDEDCLEITAIKSPVTSD